MPELALLLWLLYGVLALGVRVALHKRATGTTGLTGVEARPWSLAWLAETGHVAAIGLGFLAPILDIAGVVSPLEPLDGFIWALFGIWLFVAGLAGVTLSQMAMGESWRIGTDPEERTELVTHGPFAIVRNPIYTCLIPTLLGLALLTPSVVALASVAIFFIAMEIEARVVEEPHLARIHGERYYEYAARTGRFLPGLGHLADTHRTRPAPG